MMFVFLAHHERRVHIGLARPELIASRAPLSNDRVSLMPHVFISDIHLLYDGLVAKPLFLLSHKPAEHILFLGLPCWQRLTAAGFIRLP